MTKNGIEVIDRVTKLPPEWDAAAGDRLFLKKQSLLVLEDVNPCGQLYHIAHNKNAPSIAVTYRHKLNLLTYGAGSLNIPVTMIGIPCSVSSSGCSMSRESRNRLLDHLRGLRGMKLMLNMDNGPLDGFVTGTTLPTCKLNIKWADFNSYLSAMRSHYRYRAGKAQDSWSEVSASTLSNESFDEELYGLYLNVLHRSQYKLETLSIDFFRKFPSEIEQFRVGDKPIAFVQTVRSGNELIFMFGGMDYDTVSKYDTYMNVLLHLVRRGIEEGCSSIDMGQTTEEMKAKLGCYIEGRSLHAAHSNRLGHLALKAMATVLSYRRKKHEYRVFK